MKNYILILFMFGNVTCVNADMLSSLNTGIAKFVHGWRRLFSSEIDNKLKPEYEQLIRDLAQKMGITTDFQVFAYPASYKCMGPHCLGDRLYFDDEWFTKWADYPQVQRFIIGHELAHAEKKHIPLGWVYRLGFFIALVTLLMIIGAVWSRRRRSNKLIMGGFSEMLIIFSGAAILISGFGMLWFARHMEYEADAVALKLLSSSYSTHTIAEGAALYFAQMCPFTKHTVLQKIFETHPHPLDRLSRMPVPKKVSKDAVAKVVPLIKKRMIIRALLLHEACTIDEFTTIWQSICQAVRLCSITDQTKKTLLSSLNKEELSLLFKDLIGSLKTQQIDHAVAQQFQITDLNRLKEVFAQEKKLVSLFEDLVPQYINAHEQELVNLTQLLS